MYNRSKRSSYLFTLCLLTLMIGFTTGCVPLKGGLDLDDFDELDLSDVSDGSADSVN